MTCFNQYMIHTFKSIFLFCLLLLPVLSNAQLEAPRFDDHVFADHIKTVRLLKITDQFALPSIELSTLQADPDLGLLYLSFDDIDGDNKNYIYTITHCTADWKKSELNELEYLNGFNGEQFDNFEYSLYETRTAFTHYFLTIPNEDIQIKKSGNYIVTVYQEVRGEDPIPVITKRFMVTEEKFKINAELIRSQMVSQLKTHQKINFNIVHAKTKIANPPLEIKVMVMQNARWDNILTGFDPIPVPNKESRLEFNLQNKVVFPALKEYRIVDIRSLAFRSPQVDWIERYDDGFDVYLFGDDKRTYEPYVFDFDNNGRFFNENFDRQAKQGNSQNLSRINVPYQQSGVNIPNPINTDQNGNVLEQVAGISNSGIPRIRVFGSGSRNYVLNVSEDIDNQIESDYAYVHFSLQSPTELYDQDVYLFGGFTENKLQEDYKLKYNRDNEAYEATILLKQGFYNYLYAVKDKKNPKKINIEELEGNSVETENEYTILVYYRPFGTRYDRLMAIKTYYME